ncbi:chemotaxis protein CheC [Salimicrobium halophilum]|uniref:Chemotaxis protein CheC n=1 Tax=Salimicrobium halophilum TaxID=86666 RepID=A0A1G8QA33_9BACI|nr:chemotaxis protein CheC [Salimicrobium halophilum]SDJ01423.1 chemotaxis protein CheC [Salimicrobium halophilum]
MTAELGKFHLDVLKEIGNIGAGHGATALSSLLDRTIDMKVPEVRVAGFDEVTEMTGGAEEIVVTTYLRMTGDAPATMFFILPPDQADYFTSEMTGIRDGSFKEMNPGTMKVSAAQELGNILAGSYLSALSDFTKLDLEPSVPELAVDMFGAIVSSGLIEVSNVTDEVIIIETILVDPEKDEEINGYFLLLPDPGSYKTIFHALGVPVDED